MAGPLTSEEIEDVVSSVRRLVSNEQSSRRLSRDLGAERLLLTPSLRVVSETSPLAPLVLESPVVEAPAAPEAEPVVDDAVDLIEAEWEDELWVAPEAASLGEVALAAEEAEVLLPPAEEMPESLAPEPEDLPEEGWTDQAEPWVEDEPAPFVPLRRRAETLAAKLAAGLDSLAAQPVVTPVAEEPAPAPTRDVDPALYEDLGDGHPAEADPVVEAQAAPPEAESIHGATQRMPTEILDADGTPLAVLDEAALQDIVRQMIREELAGPLGERITRNVRKLVRAEINRALVARDLD